MAAPDCVAGHSVAIYDRGGVNRVNRLIDISELTWTRERDEWGTAKVKIEGDACRRQAGVLRGIQARRHELVIWRGAERVFEGPILQSPTRGGSIEITARDVGEYLRGTVLTQAYPPLYGEVAPGTDSALMTERIRGILEHELTASYVMTVGTGGAAHAVTVPRWEALDPPANILPHIEVRRSETLYTRSDTEPFQMTVAEHLDNLARGGLDFTTIGRRILIWDSAQTIGQTRDLTEADFSGDIEVIDAGTEHHSISHVYSQRRGDDDESPPPVGSAGGLNPYYGVWSDIVTSDSEEGADTPTQDALNSQAQRDQVGRTPVPLLVRVPRNASLQLGSGLTIGSLVPGVRMPLRATLNLRTLRQDQRLDKVTVTEDGNGERIRIDLSAWGSPTLTG